MLIAGNIAAVAILAAMLLTSGVIVGGQPVVALCRDNASVTNAGNVDVLLEGGMTGMVVLPAGDSIKVAEEENVKAEQV